MTVKIEFLVRVGKFAVTYIFVVYLGVAIALQPDVRSAVLAIAHMPTEAAPETFMYQLLATFAHLLNGEMQVCVCSYPLSPRE